MEYYHLSQLFEVSSKKDYNSYFSNQVSCLLLLGPLCSQESEKTRKTFRGEKKLESIRRRWRGNDVSFCKCSSPAMSHFVCTIDFCPYRFQQAVRSVLDLNCQSYFGSRYNGKYHVKVMFSTCRHGCKSVLECSHHDNSFPGSNVCSMRVDLVLIVA